MKTVMTRVRKEIAMIKAAIPTMCCNVVDRAIQIHGGAGVSGDTWLANAYANARSLRLADGPDEVHMDSIARAEVAEWKARRSQLSRARTKTAQTFDDAGEAAKQVKREEAASRRTSKL